MFHKHQKSGAGGSIQPSVHPALRAQHLIVGGSLQLWAFLEHGIWQGGRGAAAALLASPQPWERCRRQKARAGCLESWLQNPAELPKQTASSLGTLAFPLPPGCTKSVSAPSGRRARITPEIPGHACSDRQSSAAAARQELIPGESSTAGACAPFLVQQLHCGHSLLQHQLWHWSLPLCMSQGPRRDAGSTCHSQVLLTIYFHGTHTSSSTTFSKDSTVLG